jgi:chemotaxis protein histidine kinase CheA
VKDVQKSHAIKLQALEDENKRAKRALDDQTTSLTSSLETMQEEHERKMKTLHSDIEESEINVKSAKSAKDKIRDLTRENEELSSKLSKSKAEEKRLTTELNATKDAKKEVDRKLEDDEEHVARLKADNEDLSEQLESLKSSKKLSNDENVSRLEKEAEKLHEQARASTAQHEQDLDALKAKLRKTEEDLVSKERSLKDKENTAKELRESTKKLEQAVADSKSNIFTSNLYGSPSGLSKKSDENGGRSNFSALLKKGKDMQIKRRIVLGEMSMDMSGKASEGGLGSAAESAPPGADLGNGSMSESFAPQGLSEGKKKVTAAESFSGKASQGASSGSGAGSGAVSGTSQGASGSAPPSGSGAGSGAVSGTIPSPTLSIPSPTATPAASSPMSSTIVRQIAKKEAFLAPNKKDSVGTIVINTDPTELLLDPMKMKRFITSAHGEVCRALSVSTNAVTVSNVRAYPVLVDVTLDAAVCTSPTPELIVKLAEMCRQSSSVLKTSGSGVLAAAADLVPLRVTPNATPTSSPLYAPDASKINVSASQRRSKTAKQRSE